MKRLTIPLVLAAALVLAFTPASPPLHAQSLAQVPSIAFTPFGGGMSADDTDTAMIVKYVGTDAPGAATNVAVAAGGDLTFLKGGAAVTEFECPVAGALGGVIDVSDAACDTFGEVVDVINRSASWRAVLIGALRADSSNDTLLTIGATDATPRKGLALKFDTDVAKIASVAFMPNGDDICQFIACPGSSAPGGMRPNPFASYQAAVALVRATSTYGAGTSTIKIYSVATTQAATGSSDVTTLWSIAGGATTAEKLLDYSETPIYGRRGEKLLVRLENSGAMASVTLLTYGAIYQNP